MDELAEELPGRGVELEQAYAWFREQFAPPSKPAPALPSEVLTHQLPRFGTARALGPGEDDDIAPLDGCGHRYSSARSQLVAGRALRWLFARGGRTLVVEDDLCVRGSPYADDAAFVGNRVLRWCALTASCEEAAELLQTGASGYPRNAYVCDEPGDVLGLQVGLTLDPDLVAALASHALAAITSVWDDESYVLLWSAPR